MFKMDLINACLEKEQALESAIKSNAEADKSVGRMKRQQRAIRVIRWLVEQNCAEEVAMTDELEVDLMAILEPSKGRSSVVVHEGDTLLELWQKYSEVPDMMAKINKACDKAGLIIDGTTGALIRR